MRRFEVMLFFSYFSQSLSWKVLFLVWWCWN